MKCRHSTHFVFATLREARPFITAAGAAREQHAPYPVYRGEIGGHDIRIVICGMGMVSATAVMRHLFAAHDIQQVVNAGIAGSLKDHIGIGEIFNVRRVSVCGECIDLSTSRMGPAGSARASLLTLRTPVFDAWRRRQLSIAADLVDMEGGVIARMCQERLVPCRLVKGVSDSAEHRPQLHSNLEFVSEALAEKLTQDLKPRIPRKVPA